MSGVEKAYKLMINTEIFLPSIKKPPKHFDIEKIGILSTPWMKNWGNEKNYDVYH